MRKLLLPTVLVGVLLLVSSCTTYVPVAVDRGPLVHTHAQTGAELYSNRDCGFTTKVASAQVTRYLYVYCDSPAWLPPDTPLAGGLFNTNSVSVVDLPDPSASPLPEVNAYFNGPLPQSPIAKFITPDPYASGYPAAVDCQSSPTHARYRAQWPLSVATLPDGGDEATETVVVFFQSMCVETRLSDNAVTYLFFDVGVAVATWTAANPDAQLVATVTNAHLFPPALSRSEATFAMLTRRSYGEGAVVAPDASGNPYLYAYHCGPNADCGVARVALSASYTGAANADRVRDLRRWRYLDVNSSWSVFPGASGPNGPAPACVPTTADDCGGVAAQGKVVADADHDELATQPRAGVSVADLGFGYWGMVYSPNNGLGGEGTADSDIFMVRTTTDPGAVWTGGPAQISLPPGQCADKQCRTPILHPELNTMGLYFGLVYFDELDLPEPARGRLRFAWVCGHHFFDPGEACD